MDLLKGRIAIVSGIGPGVGKEVAYAFAREGADVVLAARTASALDEVALGIQKRRQKELRTRSSSIVPRPANRFSLRQDAAGHSARRRFHETVSWN